MLGILSYAREPVKEAAGKWAGHRCCVVYSSPVKSCDECPELLASRQEHDP